MVMMIVYTFKLPNLRGFIADQPITFEVFLVTYVLFIYNSIGYLFRCSGVYYL